MEKKKQNSEKQPKTSKKETLANDNQLPDTKSELAAVDSRFVESLKLLKGISEENKKKLLDQVYNVADKIINYHISEGDLDSVKKFKIALAIVTQKLIEAVVKIRELFKQMDEQKAA